MPGFNMLNKSFILIINICVKYVLSMCSKLIYTICRPIFQVIQVRSEKAYSCMRLNE